MEYSFILLGYLLGSIPFGLVFARLGGYGDIRAIGSGNIGATNVLRTGNKMLALLTLICDTLKGAVAVWLSFNSGDAFIILATGLFAVLGHMYPVWLKFKGGKGVATTLGTMLAIMPMLGLIMCGIWLLMALIFRISSLAALTAFAAAPVIAMALLGDYNLALLAGLIAALVFWRHKENIKRLLKGEEPKIGKKKDKNDASPASQ
ncbi:MAG: glycerol-3-phosphate 1-O-acyltransferase PlsY [Alphaproteobacteria bacterium]|nr:glycerol-3-phosphate 1-O-acyltransferase PlsY [Alphaproteobacteria bacterium]